MSWVSSRPPQFEPHGTDICSVGLAGHVLHGGYGFASRTHGLTLDFLTGATVVLADGSTKRCSATQNSDLFWALRGAGSSFGIAAELEFTTFAAPTRVTPFSVELGWTAEEAVTGLQALQDLAQSAPSELNMQIYLAPGGQTIQGVYYGSTAGLDKALKPLLKTIDAQVTTQSTMGWIEGLEHFADGTELDQTGTYDVVSPEGMKDKRGGRGDKNWLTTRRSTAHSTSPA